MVGSQLPRSLISVLVSSVTQPPTSPPRSWLPPEPRNSNKEFRDEKSILILTPVCEAWLLQAGFDFTDQSLYSWGSASLASPWLTSMEATKTATPALFNPKALVPVFYSECYTLPAISKLWKSPQHGLASSESSPQPWPQHPKPGMCPQGTCCPFSRGDLMFCLLDS